MPRWLEFLFALVVLTLLLPIFAIICVLIIFESPGNPFFLQERVGRNKKRFRIIKFRKMYVETPDDGKGLTMKNDTRLTYIGYWLDRFKLDELPQFINVLLGQMSIVGPRPEIPLYIQYYPEKWDVILSVRPGILGYAQKMISIQEADLFPENCPDPVSYYIQYILPCKLDTELEYIRKRNILIDLSVLFSVLWLYFKAIPSSIQVCIKSMFFQYSEGRQIETSFPIAESKDAIQSIPDSTL